jgi:S-DNA-T family DNA segregation ATPase FtsK/SpoIIIE
MEILETKPPSEEAGEDADEKDEMYDEAVRIVTETGQASISMIQRRLRVGYNRAARMVEQMEREGLVMPADGARPREVRQLRSVR